MIRHIPVIGCATCPYCQFHYGEHECAKFNFRQVPKQQVDNGKVPQPPSWCPLPPHPEFAGKEG